MSVLIIAEHNNKQLNPSSLHAVSAAENLGEIHILVAGYNAQAVAEEACKIKGVSKVLLADAEYYEQGLAEELTPLITKLAAQYQYIATAATSFGKNILPRVSAVLDIPQVSDVIKVIDKDTFVHPIYAGNALETVKNHAEKIAFTVRTTAFFVAKNSENNAELVRIEPEAQQGISRFIERNLSQSKRPELTQAKVIVSGGRALGSADKFNEILEPLADVLGAAIGASRAAVDAEYAPNDIQVGQTGKVVAPQLYIAVGISGAIQHVAGMQDSKIIVAINKDPDAPIFNVADYGIVGDLFEIVPQLTQALKN